MNENYPQPEMPAGCEEGILRGMYLVREGAAPKKAKEKRPRVQLLGCGTILREVIAAAELLDADFAVDADVWSATSFTELRRDGMAVERWNRLHPTGKPRRSYVEKCLDTRNGPAVAASDYMRLFAEQIRPWMNRRFVSLGTDGFGRSDMRSRLRRFFEIDRFHVAVTALKALADEGEIGSQVVAGAIDRYDIDPELPDTVKLTMYLDTVIVDAILVVPDPWTR